MDYPPNDDNQSQFTPPPPNTSYPPQQPPYQTEGLPPSSNPNYQPYPQQPMYPQQPQQPLKKKRGPFFWILIIGGALLVCVACSGISVAVSRIAFIQSTPALVPTDTATSTQSTPAPVDTSTPTQPSTSAVHFNIGETATTPDGYNVRVNKVYTSTGGEFIKPSQGNQYLVVDVSVKNSTGSTQHMADIQFTLTDTTGQSLDSTYADLANIHQFSGPLQNGSTMRGQLIYEVPKGNHPYQLAFDASMSGAYQILWDIHS
jgi:hypothetical protein